MKYIFSDLDHTLLFDGKIREKDLESIYRWKNAGNKFVIATGRGKNMMDIIFDNYPNLADYYILNNGALILDGNKNIVKKDIMNMDLAKNIIKEIDKDNFLMAIETENEIYSIGEFKDDICPEVGEKTKNIEENSLENMNLDIIFLNCAPRNACLKSAIEIYEKLINKYSDNVSIFRNKHWIDIIPKNLSKAKGIENLLKIKKLKPSTIYVIGDSLNDLSMLEAHDNSYTFHSSEDLVKNNSKNLLNNFYEMVDKILT